MSSLCLILLRLGRPVDGVFRVRMGVKEVEEMFVKNWVSTGASMDDTRKRRRRVVLALISH